MTTIGNNGRPSLSTFISLSASVECSLYCVLVMVTMNANRISPAQF